MGHSSSSGESVGSLRNKRDLKHVIMKRNSIESLLIRANNIQLCLLRSTSGAH